MHILSKYALIVGAIFIGAASSLNWLNKDNKNEPIATKTYTSPPRTETILDKNESILTKGVTSTNLSTPSKNLMLDAYRQKNGGRAFVAYAIQHPELGGIFYAQHFLRKCAMARLEDDTQLQRSQAIVDTDSNGITHAQRMEAMRILRKNCSDFTENELSEPDAIAKESAGRDTLLKASRNIYEARLKNDVNAIRSALTEILDRGGPILIDEIGIRILPFDKSKHMIAHFMGNEYRINTNAVYTAFYLLPCEMGLQCTKYEDITLALQCTHSPTCFESRRDHALAEMVGGDAKQYAEAEKLAKEIAAAIQQKNVAAFMPNP